MAPDTMYDNGGHGGAGMSSTLRLYMPQNSPNGPLQMREQTTTDCLGLRRRFEPDGLVSLACVDAVTSGFPARSATGEKSNIAPYHNFERMALHDVAASPSSMQNAEVG